MRKTLTVLLIFGLLAGALVGPAEAKKKKKAPKKVERTVEGRYDNPSVATDGAGNGGYSFPTSSDEAFVDVVVEDMTGLDVSIFVGQDVDGNGDVNGNFYCTSVENLAIEPGLEVTVFVFPGPCVTPPKPAFGTTGTITATFSNLP